jgi:hypothetical protein
MGHCSGEIVGIHAARWASRFEALEPVLPVSPLTSAASRPASTPGFTLRDDHGSPPSTSTGPLGRGRPRAAIPDRSFAAARLPQKPPFVACAE